MPESRSRPTWPVLSVRRRFSIGSLALVLLVVCGQQALGQRRSYHRGGVPSWDVPAEFAKESFQFARVDYSSTYRGWRSPGADTDWPEAELNFSFRLNQVTAIQVAPDGEFLELTDPKLREFPFLYMVEVGSLGFREEEVGILRNYLLNGGFLMVDDFWGDWQWDNFEREIRRVFPEREIVDLPLEHPVFHAVFDLSERPQIPNVRLGMESRWHGRTWESDHGPGAEHVHYRAILDDEGRIMVMICHNTDLGDGWEEEGVDEYYFREFAEKKAYPLGINILFYSMTH